MQDLSTGWLRCDPDPLFKPEHYPLLEWVPQWVSQLSRDFYTKIFEMSEQGKNNNFKLSYSVCNTQCLFEY